MSNLPVQLAAERIMTTFEKDNCFHIIVAGDKQSIHFRRNNTQYLYCLRSGEAEARRISDDTVVDYVRAPAVIGLTLRESDTIFHYLRITRPAELMATSHEQALDIIQKNSLWKEAYSLCVDAMSRCYIRDEAFASRSNYGVVKRHIEMLWEADAEQRARISAYDFILSRTSISRSSLSKILKDLSTGGYIKMHRGRLMDKKALPASY